MRRFLCLAAAGLIMLVMALVVARPFSPEGIAACVVGGIALGAGVGLWAITLEGA